MNKRRTLAMLVLLLPLVASCSQLSARRVPLPVMAEDNTARLKEHPEWPLAATVAPDFTLECFKTIHRLEREKANAGH